MLLEAVNDQPLALSRDEQARHLAKAMPARTLPCCTELHLGFFFDGTNNNKDRDTPKSSQSNIARLHDIFEVEKNKIRIYAAGVGTPFEKETSDTGKGYDASAGLAAGWGGEARINWALLQLTNQFYFYFTGQLLSAAMGTDDLSLVKQMSTDINLPDRILKAAGENEVEQLGNAATLGTLGFVVDTAVIEPRHAARKAVLEKRRAFIASKLAAMIASRKPKVLKVRMSVFGFSRGAAQARVFCNWLSDAVDSGFKLAGVPVQVDFLGIFDTVASVGLAQSALFFEGHGGWGQEEYLRIPSYIDRTVHLVSAHEVRGSFPLDKAQAGNCIEIVYPGVHSDVGGGYTPGEQGRGCGADGAPDDTAKLSQITLARMYHEAMAAGVPFNLGSSILAKRTKAAFSVSSTLIRAFNDYVDVSNAVVTAAGGGTTVSAHGQYAMYLRWRRLRLGAGAEALESQPFYKRALKLNKQDAGDLRFANDELREEAVSMATMDQSPVYSDGWMIHVLSAAFPAGQAYVEFRRAIWGEKVRQWREVKPHWNHVNPLDTRVITFFDDHVHDSRAWFKLFGSANDNVWKMEQKKRLEKLSRQDDDFQQMVRDINRDLQGTLKRYAPYSEGGTGEIPPSAVMGQDRKDLDAYRKDGSLPLEKDGREWSSVWGYLRWRTHYSDEMTLAEQAQARWNQVKSIPGDIIDRGRDMVEQAEESLVDTAARLLKSGVDTGVEAIERAAADALRRFIGGGMPRF